MMLSNSGGSVINNSVHGAYALLLSYFLKEPQYQQQQQQEQSQVLTNGLKSVCSWYCLWSWIPCDENQQGQQLKTLTNWSSIWLAQANVASKNEDKDNQHRIPGCLRWWRFDLGGSSLAMVTSQALVRMGSGGGLKWSWIGCRKRRKMTCPLSRLCCRMLPGAHHAHS